MREDESRPPFLLKFRSSKAFIVSACCIAIFTDLFFYGVLVPVIPFALTAKAGISPEDVQRWNSVLLACYAGGLLVMSPVCGFLTDRFASRRLPFVLGLVALAGSTALLCVGSSIGILLLGRILEGVSGAVIWTSGTALIVDTVSETEVGNVMGYCSLCVNLAIVLGPAIGGIVFDRSGYYAVFAVAFGLIAVDAVLRLLLVEKKVASKWNNYFEKQISCYWTYLYDKEGTPSIAATSNMESLSDFESFSKMEFIPKDPAVDSQKTLAARTASSRTTNAPLVLLLRSRRLLTALWASLVQAAILSAFDCILPIYVHRTFGWSSIGAGLIFLTIAAPSFGAPLVGKAADKYGPRWLVVVGFVVCLPLLVLLRFITHNSKQQTVLLCSLLTLLGISLTLVMTPLMAEITYVVQAKKEQNPSIFGKNGVYGQAYGLYSCFFAGGVLIGPLWAGFLEERSGWGTLTWTLGLLSGLTAIPVLFFTGGLIAQRRLKRYDDKESQERLRPNHLQWAKSPKLPAWACRLLSISNLQSYLGKVKALSSDWISSFLALISSLFKPFKPGHLRSSGSRSDYQLDKLYEQLTTQKHKVLGYPVNRNFNYKSLLKFLEFPLNNIGDPSATNSYILHTHDIERKVIHIFKQLTGGTSQEVWGYITNGGTEGNIHGLYSAREVLPDGIFYYSEASHYSVPKALRLLRVHSIMVRCQYNGEIDYEDLQNTLELYKNRPAIVIANIGTVMKGAVDSITTIRTIFGQLAIHKNYIHCDAALSGMILPFIDSAQPFGFRHGADSISISGHKLIGSPIPCGVVLIKRKNLERPRWIEYAGILDTTLTGSRSGFVPLILWYALTSFGTLKTGELTVKTQVHLALEMAEYTVQMLRRVGVPAWRNQNSLTIVFPCPRLDLVRKWQLTHERNIAHIITMPSVSRHQIDEFIRDLSTSTNL